MTSPARGASHTQNRNSDSPPIKRSRLSARDVQSNMERRRYARNPRKLVIHSRKPSKAPPGLFESSWSECFEPAIHAIHNSMPVPFSLEDVYSKVEAVCKLKHSEELYSRVREACNAHIKKQIMSLPASSVEIDSFLRAVEKVWELHCTHISRIRSLFLYLDRTYMMAHSHMNGSAFWNISLQLFRTHFVSTPHIQDKIVSGIITLINRERDGDTVDSSLLRNNLSMLTAIGMYGSVFEKQFLDLTDEYYRKECGNLIRTLDVPSYLIFSERRLSEEFQRLSQYLNSSTRNPLMSTVEKRVVCDHVNTLLDKGFYAMCEQGRKDDIRRCYSVLTRANEHMPPEFDNAHDLMKAKLVAYIKDVGRKFVMDREKDSDMVQLLLDLKAQLDELVSYSFDGADVFCNAVNLAFEYFVNSRENKPAELIAKFVDGILRTGNKGFSEEELEKTLDKALTLFRFIDGKDVFEAFYKRDLAKRLLYDKSASLDLEKSMISKLKAECGSQFTSKLEAMFRDVNLSKELMQSFNTHAASRERIGDSVELNVFVLEAARWPLSTQTMTLKLPQALMEYQETFKSFYLTKHSGRKLSWQHSDGSCTVYASFPKGTKVLQLSLCQTIVVLLFNDADELSYSSIQEGTGIEEQELKRTLLSLACGKVRVLQKKPKGPTIGSTDTFMFNKGFQHRQTRLKVNAIQLKESNEENAATTEKVFQERNYQIDAAVVRIMKTRRTIHHAGLISEVYQQLRFPHKPLDVKKRIESLIDREYLERDQKNPQTYHYLA